jgi:5-oxoprolinase (ATP-hydrolysing) subunit C
MSLRVVSPGTHTLIVDAGRPASRGLGVPVGGPADQGSLALGNTLVGNLPFTPALEITLSGPTLLAEVDVGMCVFGSPFRIECDGASIQSSHTFTLKKGQSLQIGGTPTGCRAYLCVRGGFQVSQVLSSATAFDPVAAGDVLSCKPSQLAGRCLAEPSDEIDDKTCLRCLPGPQADWFDDSIFSHTYRVLPASNRMGVRLEGPPLALPKRDLVSEPVAPGAVQITNDGKPIVLGVDGQTIGGYPKIAHVISADLDALGQLRPGDEVEFRRVSEAVAEAAAARRRDVLAKSLRRIAAGV